MISDGKYHDNNLLDLLVFAPNAIYLIDKNYVDFEVLYRISYAEVFFILRKKSNLDNSTVERKFNIATATGLSMDKTVAHNWHRFKKLFPGPQRLVENDDRENEVGILFLTNNMEVSALEVAKL
ncbi:MAG TPA: hypothetical protein ENH60_05370 [Pricia sp.]|nr:hypothetical protein [Pricia sp.]